MLEIASKIDRVRVGRAHAEITRVLDVVLPNAEEVVPPEGDEDASPRPHDPPRALPERFVIPGLTLALEDGSVRVAVERSAGVDGAAGDGRDAPRVKSARVALVAEERDRSLEGAEEAVRAAAQALALAQRLASVCEASIDALRAVPSVERPRGKRGEGPLASPIEARMALARLQRERGEGLAAELVKRRAAVVAAEKQHREALAREAQASTARPPQSDELKKAIVVDLDPAGATRARLVVTYVVPGARWMPAYTLRVDGGTAALQIRALVQQNTGEDWSGVALALSTADVERATSLPELQSARIGRAQPKKRTGFRAPPAGAAELFADYAAVLATRPAPHAPDSTSTRSVAPTNVGSTTALFEAGEMLADLADDADEQFVGGIAPAPGGGAYAESPKAAMPPMPARASAPQGRPMAQQARARLNLKDRLGAVVARDALLGAALDQGGGEARGGGVMRKKSLDARREEPLMGAQASIDVDAGALAFASLRMPPPDAVGRGELQRLGAAEAYVELSVDVTIGARASARLPSTALAAVLHSASHPWLAAPPARHAPAESYAGFDFSFESDARVDLPSDGEAHAVALSTATAPAKVFHVVVPRESRDVFRCLEVTNPLDAPLLAGPLDVYEGRDFLLSTDLSTTPPRGILRVGLGVDSAVKVARNIDFGETITGLMRGSLDLWHKVSCEITNGRSDVVRVDVRERVPTTLREKDVKVEVVRVEPMWKGYEDPTHPIQGGHVWQIDLAPGEKRTLALEYVVHIASKHELAGGNRREE